MLGLQGIIAWLIDSLGWNDLSGGTSSVGKLRVLFQPVLPFLWGSGDIAAKCVKQVIWASFIRWELGGVGCGWGETLCPPLEPSYPSWLGGISAELISRIIFPYLMPPSLTFSLILWIVRCICPFSYQTIAFRGFHLRWVRTWSRLHGRECFCRFHKLACRGGRTFRRMGWWCWRSSLGPFHAWAPLRLCVLEGNLLLIYGGMLT